MRLRGGILDDPLAAAAAPQVTNMYVSFYASVVFEERAGRIRLVAFGGGLVAALASLAGVVVADYESSFLLIMTTALVWGVFAMLIAVLPTDEDLVRGLCVYMVLLLLPLGWYIWWLARPWSIVVLNPWATTELLENSTWSALAIVISLLSSAGLQTWRDAFLAGLLPCRFNTRAGPLAMTASACLRRLWLVMRLCVGATGIQAAIAPLPDLDWPNHLGGALILLSAIALRPSFRRYLQARLARLGASGGGEDAQLAALAELSGGGEKALARAVAAFRLLPFDKLTGADELPGGGVAGGAGDALRERAVAASLGAEFSVYVSHSWHDSREGKWAALKRWAERDTEVRGSAPLLWLDAACVAREEAGSLELLPLLVSGCQRFLILAGPTYANRRAGGGRETCLESAPSPTLTLARGRASQALVRG